MEPDEIVTKALTFIVLLIVLIGFFGGAGGALRTVEDVDTSLNITDGSAHFGHAEVKNLTAEQTLGTALAFDGDGVVEADSGGDLVGNWSVCTWTTVDDTDANMTVLSRSGEQTIQYLGNQSSPQWVGRYYDAGEREDYDVAVAATDPENRTHLCFQQTNQDITLFANTSSSGSVTTTGAYTLTDARYNISSLNGTVDETRLYNASLSSSDRQSLRDHPSRPLSSATPTARLMYDARSGPVSSLPVYFTGSDATVTNATLVGGLPGDSLVRGTDYTVNKPPLSNPVLTAVGGGDLDGAPVVFVSYRGESIALGGTFAAMWATLTQVPGFVALGIVVLAGAVLMQLIKEDF